MEIIIILIVVGIVLLVTASKTKCPKCGKRFALKQVTRYYIGTTYGTKTVEHDIKDKDGNKIGSYETTEPTKTDVYEYVYECKYCKHRESVTEYK